MFLEMRNVNSLFFWYTKNISVYENDLGHCFFNKGAETLRQG